jgi:cytidylate kinase
VSRDDGPVIVAIDGPGGVGKSTVTRLLARRLSLPYLETGAMYRALGLKVLDEALDPADEPAVSRLAETLDLEIEALPDGGTSIRLDGRAVGERLRDERVAQVTSQVAQYPRVRQRMVDLQRRFGRRQGAVMEGRDIGTRVFPETPFKFFLEADPEVRVRRRLGEHRERGAGEQDPEALRRELLERDERDRRRADSPLRRDASYTAIDTSRLTAEEVAERIAAVVERSG